jgi:hypothetical protein
MELFGWLIFICKLLRVCVNKVASAVVWLALVLVIWLTISDALLWGGGEEWMLQISSSTSPSWEGVILDSDSPTNGSKFLTLDVQLTLKYSGEAHFCKHYDLCFLEPNGPSCWGDNLLLRCWGNRSLCRCNHTRSLGWNVTSFLPLFACFACCADFFSIFLLVSWCRFLINFCLFAAIMLTCSYNSKGKRSMGVYDLNP